MNLQTYLRVQLGEIAEYGENHALTYAPARPVTAPRLWLEARVCFGEGWYWAVQFPLPQGKTMTECGTVLRSAGWASPNTEHSLILLYFLAKSPSFARFQAQLDGVAEVLALLLSLLWEVNAPQDLQMLGARGPRLTLSKAA